ncbi:MAG TPA: N-acetylmuramoyl-L-alanine amidase [Candidatus Acetothermia bacterium]|nr:N-acetylmuramoyl-L-alanine amidase [Candidatus Bipolaricaulota bacterium]HDJ29638.1 N-acetylmuramoyl-L-alanine amidase [Candidatus Acetothermia bacterium]
MTRRFKLTFIGIALVVALFSLTLSAGGPTWSYRYTVVIDPGHGGKDPGAIGIGGLEEKSITLDIAKMVYLKSLSYPELRVILTRRDDTYTYPTDRVLTANRLGADLYVSIHANAHSSPSASGIETLVHESKGRDTPCYHLAELLQRELVAATGAEDRGIKWAPLFIRRAQMPAALVEVGFVTNPREARLLQTISYQSIIAEAILDGILDYLKIPHA